MLSIFVLFISLQLVAVTSASSKVTERMIQRPGNTFAKQHRCDPTEKHEVVFAVRQQNFELLDKILLERSTPRSPLYQKWLTFDEVTKITNVPEAGKAVLGWLESHRQVNVTWTSLNNNYIKATAPVEFWDKQLQAEFHHFKDFTLPKHKQERTIVRSETYTIPEEIQEHVTAIFNTAQALPEYKQKYYEAKEKDQVLIKKYKKDGAPPAGVTNVAFLDSYYGIPSSSGNAAIYQSVFETSNEYFSPTDLTNFQSYFGLPIQAAEDIGGHEADEGTCDLKTNDIDCYEGNLDIQFIMGVAQYTTSIYWWVGGADPFVDWVTTMANEDDPPSVNSMSWGSREQYYSTAGMDQFNTEAQKLGTMGVTITISSGDNGVTYSSSTCNENSGSSTSPWTGTNTWTGQGYFPSFPATSPYVTAVGATQGPEEGQPEIPCQADLGGVITTGGGFSTYFAQPSWQSTYVTNYFATVTTQPAAGYNVEGRGYPDVAMLGVKYEVMVNNEIVLLYGTSASSPVFAAMISLLNAARYLNGQPTVGYLNPTLYDATTNQNGALFNDQTSGENNCPANASGPMCCKAGFYAAVGWDPVTGFGSIMYSNLELMF